MMNDIPLIDLTPARTGGEDGARAVSALIDRACRDVGFFTIRGHGIDPRITADAYDGLDRFFARSMDEKVACKLDSGFTFSDDEYTPYGYSALLEENAYAYMGEPDKPSDYVEKFSVGHLVKDDATELPFNLDDAGRDFRVKLKRYYALCEHLANWMTELFTYSLDLPRDHFAKRIDKSNDSMRCHRYPAYTSDFANHQGMGAHLDSTLITILTHTAPGIQVKTKAGDWVTPKFRALDEFIVNIGDLMAHWTDNAYISTPHQVVLTDHPRLSIVFFKLTNEDEVTAVGNKQMDALFGRA